MGIFRTKPIVAESSSELKRALGPGALIGLGIGAIIGTGIFVLTGVAAAEHAGPALILAFVVAGIACAFAALCYAEFAAMIPVSGSAYSYAYSTLGEGVAWFVGWLLVLEYLFAASTVSVGWSGYIVSLMDQIGWHIPKELSSA
ncbi:MAG: amino acid permease, partial [Steroidobacteraceae bacterium]